MKALLWSISVWIFIQSPATAQPKTQPYLIGAWYFGLWSNKEDSRQLRNALKYYGRDDVWGGVRDCAKGCETKGVTPKDEDLSSFRSRHPLIGYYDMSNAGTVERHLQQAATAGLSFFSVYWYVDHDGRIRYDPTPAMRTSKFPVKYALAPISLRGEISKDIWRDIIAPTILGHFHEPNYLRIDGRPTLIMFNFKFADRDYYEHALNFLRQEAKRQGLGEPFIVYTLDTNSTQDTVQKLANNQTIDAFTCHVFQIHGNPETYDNYRREWLKISANQISMVARTQADYIPCPVVGFDARPWFWIAGGPNPARKWRTQDERPYLIGNTISEFSRHLLDVKSLILSNPKTTKRAAIIYAWNEWGEGGSIEPSRIFGYSPLFVIRDIFDLNPTSRPFCPKLPDRIPGCPN